ncbi:antitoxin Xre/MbcA/ParS toxin-binding domain-containing protein [Roseomonas chloroacetimidivorans]|uniref:antitoxin Xre/MbcA/ParS toxin-binding domain-containing protein n=1 Tax=Roseomonas chloroacetimidivorans TaxID=1766656 RepID=UPI003C710D8D
MQRDVRVEILVDEATAELLRSPAHREIIGELVMRIAKPSDGQDPLSGQFEGELLLRQEAGQAVTGLNAGQAASITSQPTRHMSDEEMLAPWPTPIVVADIVAYAARVLGSDGAAKWWLFSPMMLLGGQRPIELLAANEGAKRIVTLLGQIEYGVYS